jgi:cytochrome c-type biogenesis protein CcmH
MIRRILFAAVMALVCSSNAFAIDAKPAFDDPILLARYQHLTRELRCLVCQNETIADSNAPLAADLRRELRGLIAAGKTDDEIRTFLTDRYGDFVLYNPPFVARTWLLWAAPALALLGGLSIAIVVIRRRAQLPIEADTATDVNVDTAGTKTP